MTDEEILREKIDLSKSSLTNKEKERLMRMIIKHKKAFSLRDEIGECPNLKVAIDIVDDSPFFVRPFPIAEADKPIMDKQMNRLVELGILSKNCTSHTSPVMLITRKLTNDKRPIVDFRLLNTRIRRRNNAVPLLRDIFKILGHSQCDVMSCVDIKDAYHSIKLEEKSKEYCGILPYFGSQHYRYEVLPMGLGSSPAIWMTYVNFLLESMKKRDRIIAIMDDLLIHSKRGEHFELLEQLFVAMIKNGLKLSPKKSQLFMTQLVYLGTLFTIEKGRMQITPLRTRIDAIMNIPAPKTPKGCKSFCGVVNYLALFCQDLQKLLIPIYNLTRKGEKFIWSEECAKNFAEIKRRLCEHPVLHLPIPHGRMILYSDTSRQHAGSALWQIQNGAPKLVGYSSKTLPKACKNYSVTELEMLGLAINLHSWQHFLSKIDFDCATDHLAAVQILHGKREPASNRIKTILEKILDYTFQLYYVKGKDLILADYFSRVAADTTPPSECLPISFLTHRQPQTAENTVNIVTRRRAGATGMKVPDVHGAHKRLDPNVKPEHQKRAESQKYQQTRPVPPKYENIQRSRHAYIPNAPKKVTQNIPIRRLNTAKHPRETVETKPLPIQRPLASKPLEPPSLQNPVDINRPTIPPPPVPIQPQPRIPTRERFENLDQMDLNLDPLMDIQSPYDDALVEIQYRRPTPDDFKIPNILDKEVDSSTIMAKHLPKQVDVDKVRKQIERKVLRQTHLPIAIRDLQAAYLKSAQFRDIYLYLTQNKGQKTKSKQKQLEQMSEKYIVLDTLLFKITWDKARNEYDSVLCIPTSKVDMLLDLYHSTLSGGHAGVTKCYLTISQRFYCPNLASHIRAYITGCHVCQLLKTGPRFNRPHQKRVNINTPAMSKISMDIKHMPSVDTGKRDEKGNPICWKYMLVLLCEISNFVVLTPLKSTKTNEICEAISHSLIRNFGNPVCIICDQDPAFTSYLFTYFTRQKGIRIYTVGVTNHKSLLAEHGIKSLSEIIKSYMYQGNGPWTWFVDDAMCSYNWSASPNLGGLCPHELVFTNKPRLYPALEVKPDAPIAGTHREYKIKLDKDNARLRMFLQKFRDERHDIMNRDRELHGFQVGEIVYLYMPSGAVLQTGTRKFRGEFMGPMVIYKAISPTQFLLISLDGEIYPRLIEETRLKPGIMRTVQGNVSKISDLKTVLRGGLLTQKLK